jgi:SRSO17 transposase
MIQRSWTTGVPIETALDLWASSLRDVKQRIRPLLRGGSAWRVPPGWMRAEAAGDPGPWRQQALLGRAQWDADALRDIVRD